MKQKQVAMVKVGEYQVHPVLFKAMRGERGVLKEMRGEFTPTTGCGQELLKVVELFNAAAKQEEQHGRRGSSHAWNALHKLIAVERMSATSLQQMSECAARLLCIYIYG